MSPSSSPGYATDTQDAHGAIVSGGGARATRAQLEAVLLRFIGDIAQIPPMYSALQAGWGRSSAIWRGRGLT